ncbi:MAG: ABC transporter ATP-binding protein [Lachnospiraceae bacterium]|nr:ABC transporter ATP-binding protein [Lachnospiraceae bacterium]
MLKVNSIKKSIKTKSATTHILKGISFSVNQGEMVAIMGPSGCGKSTLLGIIAGLDKPDSGSVSLNGKKMYEMPSDKLDSFRARHISIVFQNYGLIKELNCKDNIMLPLIFSGSSQNLISKSLYEQLGLKELLNRYPNEMSGGEQQRAAIARALITGPDIILADEPTGSLDQKTGLEIMAMFRKTALQKKTVLIVTHDKTVADLCDRIIQMKDGELSG